jgi:hypothetical protein
MCSRSGTRRKTRGDGSAPLLREFEMPRPDRSAAFETMIFQTR